MHATVQGANSRTPLMLWLRSRSATLLALCLALAIGTSLWLGQDSNWDLQNYHYYNPYAWVYDRADIDVAPAQLQTYHSPFADLPYYFMTRAGVSPWLIGIVLALPAAAALYFLALIAELLLPLPMRRYGTIAVLFAAASGACGRPVIGSTMSEWHIAALFVAAIWLALKFGYDGEEEQPKPWRRHLWLICGLLTGAAVGLKLTGAAFGVAFVFLVLFAPGTVRKRAGNVCYWVLGSAIGFVLLYGPWAWHLWVHFQSPFFPYFNNLFHAPLAEPISYADPRFMANSLEKLLTLPFKLMSKTSGLVTEVSMRDWRLVLGLPALALLAFAGAAEAGLRSRWRTLFLFGLVSYCIWAWVSGIYRYVGTLELLVSLAIIALIGGLVQRRTGVAVLILTPLLIFETLWPAWGRISFEKPAVRVELPVLPANSMVVISSGEPLGYVVPSIPPEVPVISLINFFLHLEPGRNQMQVRATQRVNDHRGPLWLLMHRRWPMEKYSKNRLMPDAMKELGYQAELADCLPIRAVVHDDLVFCRLSRIAPPKT